ncbi:MAG: hypothetical protein ACO3G4_14475 [Opitutaceae bacterium]|jgi:hypothetical protein
MRVILTPGDITIATTLACVRQGVNREAGKVNQKAGAQDAMTTELVGTFGEIAFARWANVYPDMTTHLRAGSPDARFGPLTVDVKTTRRVDAPRWTVDCRADKCFDVYVFAAADWATVTLLGWITRTEALRFTQENQGLVTPAHLTKMDELSEYADELLAYGSIR